MKIIRATFIDGTKQEVEVPSGQVDLVIKYITDTLGSSISHIEIIDKEAV